MVATRPTDTPPGKKSYLCPHCYKIYTSKNKLDVCLFCKKQLSSLVMQIIPQTKKVPSPERIPCSNETEKSTTEKPQPQGGERLANSSLHINNKTGGKPLPNTIKETGGKPPPSTIKETGAKPPPSTIKETGGKPPPSTIKETGGKPPIKESKVVRQSRKRTKKLPQVEKIAAIDVVPSDKRHVGPISEIPNVHPGVNDVREPRMLRKRSKKRGSELSHVHTISPIKDKTLLQNDVKSRLRTTLKARKQKERQKINAPRISHAVPPSPISHPVPTSPKVNPNEFQGTAGERLYTCSLCSLGSMSSSKPDVCRFCKGPFTHTNRPSVAPHINQTSEPSQGKYISTPNGSGKGLRVGTDHAYQKSSARRISPEFDRFPECGKLTTTSRRKPPTVSHVAKNNYLCVNCGNIFPSSSKSDLCPGCSTHLKCSSTVVKQNTKSPGKCALVPPTGRETNKPKQILIFYPTGRETSQHREQMWRNLKISPSQGEELCTDLGEDEERKHRCPSCCKQFTLASSSLPEVCPHCCKRYNKRSADHSPHELHPRHSQEKRGRLNNLT